VDEGRTTTRWSEATLTRVAQHLLATLRDFGVLEGAVNKRLSPSPLAPEAFAFVAFDRSRDQPSGSRVLRDRVWITFFLDQNLVEQHFLAAHQEGLLHYAAAGSAVRLEFPASSLEEYARILASHARSEHAGPAA
jgi:hypothetical protein